MELVGIKKKQNSIVELLKDEILSGNIACGTEMTQNELAQALGVSRMPVREALIILEYQGLVERLPNNHVRVASFAENFFPEVFSMCMKLEMRSLENWPQRGQTTEKRNRFANESSKEMQIHQDICKNLSNSFMKKTLETLVDIYVDFALRQEKYDGTAGCVLLEKIREKVEKKDLTWEKDLEQYFRQMTEAVEKRDRLC